MPTTPQLTDRIVCHCLQVTESQIRESAARGTLQNIQDIRQLTGAGDGCTACHCAIKRVLDHVRSEHSA